MDAPAAEQERGGESPAARMEDIVAEHETALLRYATRIVGNSWTAQDVVQNVFIKLFQQWQPGTPRGAPLKAWLYRVTHNEAIDHLRHESRLRLLHEKQAQEEACADGTNCGADEDAEEKRERVLGCLRRLHPREQQVVLLRLEEGLSYREIGAITGRTEGNVGNILHHAVRKLANRLKAEP